jgi:hypothetical protein
MHPYMASAIAEARQRDLIRAAEDWRRAAEARTATATPKDGTPRAGTRQVEETPNLLRRLRAWRWHPVYR